MTVTLPGAAGETRQVLFTAQVLSNVQLSLQNASIVFRLDGAGATLAAHQIQVLAGGAFSPPVQMFLDSPVFRGLLEAAVRLQLTSMAQFAPPLNLSILGNIANATSAKLSWRILDGALAIGLDLDEGGVQTAGDPSRLSDVTAGNDIGMFLNPAALPVAMAFVSDSVAQIVAAQSATLESFSLTVEDGHFHIAGKASRTEGSVTFSMNAVPRLIRPGVHMEWEEEYGEHFEFDTPPREELWFEMRDVVVDVHRAWWVSLLQVFGGLLSFGIGALVVESIVDMVRNNILAGIAAQGGKSISSRIQEFTLAGTTGPTIRLKLECYACFSDSVFTGITLRPKLPKPGVDEHGSQFIEGVLADPPRYSVRLPFDAHPEDPQMVVRWTVRRVDLNEVVLMQEGQAGANQDFTLASIVQILLQTTKFTVECRVCRILGANATDFFNASRKLTISDTLDRSHPYVRWHHWVYPPVLRVENDGSRTELGRALTARQSRLHRTAYPGRCRMVAHYSLGAPDPPRSPFGHPVPDPLLPAPEIEYLDALPFPREELNSHREQLCDYCFFGGPTKTTPLIP